MKGVFMGFLNSLIGAFVDVSDSIIKQGYHNATGRDYDDDLQMYFRVWERKGDYELEKRWNELSGDDGVRHAAEKNAVRELMKERGLSL